MSQLFYHLKNLPPSLYDQGACQPFRAALPAWRKLGLGSIVDRVDGNGVLHRLDNGVERLCVWPPHGEYSPPIGDEHCELIDDELTISWFGDKPPGPDDLDNGNPLRLRTVPLVLADSEVWQIPEIREPSGSLLPTDLVRCRKTGRLLNPIKKEYLQLWEESEFWFDLKWKQLQGLATSFNLDRGLRFATQVIGLRYRFCDATQAALRILDSVNLQQVIEAAIGWQAVLEVVNRLIAESEDDQKKSLDPSVGNVSGSSGPEASGHSINQHGANNG